MTSDAKENNYFAIDDSYLPPPPLDRSISTIAISTSTNNLKDGLDLSLSAQFGYDTISFKDDQDNIWIMNIEIYRALITITPYNCNISATNNIPSHDDEAFQFEHILKSSQVGDSQSATSTGASTNVSAGLNKISTMGIHARADVSRSRSMSMSDNINAIRKYSQVSRKGHDSLMIEAPPNHTPLSGSLVSNFSG